MKFSIRTRLSLAFALVFTVLVVLFSGVIYYLMSSNLERKLREDSEHDIQLLLEDFNTKPWDAVLAELAEETEEMQVFIQVIDGQGEVLSRSSGVKEWDWPVDQGLLTNSLRKPIWSDIDIGETSHLVLTRSFTPVNKATHFLQVANSRELINLFKNLLIYCVNIGTPLVLIVALIAGRFLSKRALEPVDRIRKRAQTINSDNLHDRLIYDGPPDELHRLTQTLNDLLDRVEMTVNQMKRFIADASHELRIPITGLRGTVEVALRQDRSKEEYKRTLETVYGESERLSELVWDLLSLVRVDAGEMKLEKTNVDIESFLKNVFDEAEALNAEKRVNLRLGSVPKGRAEFDEAKVHQLLINVIENAINYNKPGGDVVLSAELDSRNLVVSVKDTGVGIAPPDQSRIFDRFYRVDKARSRETRGTGLGLSIARAIA